MSGPLAGHLGLLLAEAGPDKAPADNPEWGKAAPVGLFVLLVFVVVCVFLFRSMGRQMRKVPADFASGRPADAAAEHAGEAKTVVPLRESEDRSGQSAPRLGTPEDMLSAHEAKRREKVRRAKERRKRY